MSESSTYNTPEVKEVLSLKRGRGSSDEDQDTPKQVSRRRLDMGDETAKLLRDIKQQMATKTDIDQIKESLAARIDGIQASLEKFEKINEAYEKVAADLAKVHEENESLKKQLDYWDRHSRRNNIIIKGLEPATDDVGKEAKQFLQDKLEMSASAIVVRAFRLGRKQPGSVSAPRVLVEVLQDAAVYGVFKNADKLYKTGYSIARDMAPSLREKHYKLMSLRWRIKQACPGVRVSVSYDRMRMDDKYFEWQNGGLKCGNEDGIEVLKGVTGKDFTAAVLEVGETRKNDGIS